MSIHQADSFAKPYGDHLLTKNLNLLISECRISLGELSRNTGIPIATIQRIRSEPNCNPTLSSLQPLADFFSISVSQLIGDEPLPSERIPGSYKQNKEKWIKIPIISWEQATVWPNIAMKKNIQTISTDIDVGGNTFALEIAEDDWIGFQKNSVVIIDPNRAPQDRDYVITHKTGIQAATLKKYLIYDGTYYLVPLNDKFSTILLNEEYRILGVIIQIRKDIHK